MAAQSSMHFYLNWAKERIDEMDAALASLENKAGEVQADARVKANQVRADLEKSAMISETPSRSRWEQMRPLGSKRKHN